MHSSVSGVSDFLAVSELDALRKAREIVASLNIRPVKRFGFLFVCSGRRIAPLCSQIALASIR